VFNIIFPCECSWHAAVYLKEKHALVVIGGFDGEHALSDAFILDLSTRTWRVIAQFLSRPTAGLCRFLGLSFAMLNSVISYGWFASFRAQRGLFG
jgi:hypothetical protein